MAAAATSLSAEAQKELLLAMGLPFESWKADSPLGDFVMGGTSRVLDDPTVRAIAKRHNATAAQVALRWVTQQGVIAVTRSAEIEHVREDLAIFDLTLSGDEMARLAAIPGDL